MRVRPPTQQNKSKRYRSITSETLLPLQTNEMRDLTLVSGCFSWFRFTRVVPLSYWGLTRWAGAAAGGVAG